MGECIYDWSMRGLADNIEKFAKDALFKDTFNAQVTNTQVKFVLDEKATGYGFASLQGGQLVVSFKPGNLCANVGQIAENLPDIFMVNNVSLKNRQDMAKYNNKLQENLGKLKTATGRDWTLDFDEVAFAEAVGKRNYAVSSFF